MSIALVVVGLVAGVLLLWRRAELPPATTTEGAWPRISVIVPARDEEASLPRLLASLADQTAAPAEVIVVDDDSSDSTAALAAAAGAQVVPAGGPPAGWTGKTWACDVGVRAASGDVLVLLDADTSLAPDGLARVVIAHRSDAPDGLVSVQPHHRTLRPYEQASAVSNLVSVMASGVCAVVRPRRRPVAFGPCIATTKAAIETAGGFGSVRTEVAEDIALARRFEAAGLTVAGFLGRGAVTYRMYPDGARSLIQGWAKNLVAGAARAPVLPAIGATLWVTGALSVGLAARSPSVVVAAAWAAYGMQTWWMLRRLGSFRWWTSALFPVAVAGFALLVLASAFARLRGRASWRGREVALGKRVP